MFHFGEICKGCPPILQMTSQIKMTPMLRDFNLTLFWRLFDDTRKETDLVKALITFISRYHTEVDPLRVHTPLIAVVKYMFDSSLIRQLLVYELSDINEKDCFGNPAIYYLGEQGNYAAITCLRDLGADIQPAMNGAVKRHKLECVVRLLQHYRNTKFTYDFNDLAQQPLLVQKLLYTRPYDEWYRNPLTTLVHVLCATNDGTSHVILDSLLKSNLPRGVFNSMDTYYKATPAYIACEQNNFKAFELLLQRRMDFSAVKNGETIMHMLYRRNDEKYINPLAQVYPGLLTIRNERGLKPIEVKPLI